MLVLEGKAERLDQVQRRSCGQREPACSTRVVRDFRFNQNDVKHDCGKSGLPTARQCERKTECADEDEITR